MSLCVLNSRAREGIQAPAVTVEVHLAGGLPVLSIVGLPELAVKESKDRVRGALLNSRFQFPIGRVTINLAPADLPPVAGVLPAALAARDAGRALILPRENADEAALVSGLTIYPAEHLLEVCEHLNGTALLSPFERPHLARSPVEYPDLAEVRGQEQAKRALEIAAAGAHSLLFLGPPGTGKSMLANRLPGILPIMTEGEALEAVAVRSVSGREPFDPRNWRRRPFRAPHHTASSVALVGGGGNPRPGEISLAHQGILFLDEFPEFDRRVLEALREPLESGYIHISRAARQAEFPARFQLVAAMNPCPCGYLGDASSRCTCTAEQVARYRARISGPLLDRIDLHVEVPRVSADHLNAPAADDVETSDQVRARVEPARECQLSRAGKPNQSLTPSEIDRTCPLGEAARRLMGQALQQLGLSARAYHRVLKVARTIADLAACDRIETAHLSEAIGYRKLDRAGPPR